MYERALLHEVKARSNTMFSFVVGAVFRSLTFGKTDLKSFMKFVFWSFCILKLKSPTTITLSDNCNCDKDMRCFLKSPKEHRGAL